MGRRCARPRLGNARACLRRPANTIRAQVKALANRLRLSANPSSFTNSMHQIASAVRDSEVAVAARSFSEARSPGNHYV